ncbi:MAG TPA: hypothetical protein VI756_12435 [Blastocatellia bacterium]
MDQTIKNLIEGREIVHEALTPSELPAGHSTKARALAEISFMSGRAESWKTYLGLVGYSHQGGHDLNDVLRAVSGEGPDNFGHRDKFLSYSQPLTGLPETTLVPVARTIAIMTKGQLAPVHAELTSIDICSRKCRSAKDQEGCIRDCMEGLRVRPVFFLFLHGSYDRPLLPGNSWRG